jgi:hypothetical protein
MICYVCKINMQKQVIVKEDVIRSIKYICPACNMVQEEEFDASCSKYSAYSELDILKEV